MRRGRALPALALLLLPALGGARARAQEGSSARPGLVTVGGLLLFYDAQGPLSFVPMTPGDLPKGAAVLPGELFARSCQYGLSLPISASLRATSVSGAVGNGGYEKAMAALRVEHPEVRGLFDVKIDVRTTVVLGLWRRQCVELTGRAFR